MEEPRLFTECRIIHGDHVHVWYADPDLQPSDWDAILPEIEDFCDTLHGRPLANRAGDETP